MNKGSGRIRATTEVNFKTRMDAHVFGEDDRVINPGDLVIVMQEEGPGDRQNKNMRQFEISVAGDQLDYLLKQVTRAKELYDQNKEWLKTPMTTPPKVKPVPVDRIAIEPGQLAALRAYSRANPPRLVDLPNP